MILFYRKVRCNSLVNMRIGKIIKRAIMDMILMVNSIQFFPKITMQIRDENATLITIMEIL